MTRLRALVLQTAAVVLVALGRLVARLPDRVLVPLLALAERAARRASPAGPGAMALADVREILASEPEWNRAIRALLLEGRRSQAVSLLRGLLQHHVLGWSCVGLPTIPAVSPGSRGRPGPSVRVALIGSGGDLDALAATYSSRCDCRVTRIETTDPARIDARLAEVDAAEIACPADVAERVVSLALARKVVPSIHHASLASAEVLRRLTDEAARAGVLLRVLYPAAAYPPVQMVRALLARDEIGEVSNLRVRATIGGNGGALPPALPDRERYLAHPALDHLLLLALLGGPVASVGAYLRPMREDEGGQGIVQCRFRHPGRYGALECTFAPGLFLRSEVEPYDLEVEIAGTDGILFLRRGPAERVQAAPVLVRVGRSSYTIGVESGLGLAWRDAFPALADEMVAMVCGGRRPATTTLDLAISALAAREAAYRSSAEGRIVPV